MNISEEQKARGNVKVAFTLAEVLITLGIIGIVAAMTLPVLIENHQKRVVETRLQKFYIVFNSALRASVAENGDMSTWTFPTSYYDREGADVFFETYLKKYLVYKKTKSSVDTIWPTYGTEIYLNDGSAFVVSGGPWITYYPVAKKTKQSGVDVFLFIMHPSKNAILPHGYDYIVHNNQMTYINNTVFSCNANSMRAYNRSCAAYIMRNSWKIPKDYPFSKLKRN